MKNVLPWAEFQDIILANTLDARQRIEIYRTMYKARMKDALIMDFPSLHAYIGETAFLNCVQDYCISYPSQSYTLNDSGLNFPEFLAHTDIKEKDFLIELARMELAISQIMDMPGPDKIADIQSIIQSTPPEQWMQLHFLPIQAFMLCCFDYTITPFLIDSRGSRSSIAQQPVKEAEYLYIYRQNYSTNYTVLQRAEYIVLHSLISGKNLGEAVLCLLEEQSQISAQELSDFLQHCFAEWAGRGIFSSLYLAPEHLE
jgi:hypothetical protein